jgi:ligand-binding sensor domain-containing protein
MIRYTYIAIISVLFLLFLPITSFAQYDELKFEHLSRKQGLSQITVACIVQDIRGFMWFGTGDGLNKYDGYSFTVYKHDPQDLQSLGGNDVRSICEDKTGVLWIGTYGGGLNKFDQERGTFTSYKHDPNDPQSLSDNRVSSIYESKTGVLWIGTDGGGFNKLVQGDNEESPPTFTRYKHDPNDPQSLSNNDVFSIYEDHTGVLWIGTYGGGLNKLVPGDNEESPPTFVHYKQDPKGSQGLRNNVVLSIYEDRTGVLWIGTYSGGLNKFDREKETFTRYKHDPNDTQSLSDNGVSSIYEDRTGVLWIGTFGGGLNKLIPGNDVESPPTFVYYKHKPNDPQSLSGNDVRSIYEDQTGVLWIGGGGLNKFDREKEKFGHYKKDSDDPQSLSGSSVFPIYEDRTGVVWIGTYGRGLNKFDREKETFTHYKHDPEDPKSLSADIIYSIYEDQSGVLWIGTDGGGLNKLVPGDNEESPPTFVHYKHDPDNPQSLSANIVTSICEDQTGVLWIGTFGGGLNQLVPGDNEESPPSFVHYKYDSNDPKSLSDSRVISIYKDQTGVLWIGTAGGGLNQLVRSDNEESPLTFIHYKQDPNNPQSLNDNGVMSIHEDHTGALWIGTGSGLNKFDRARGTFQHYREKDGLPNDVIYGILEDDNRNLWLSTNEGLSKFNLQTKKFRNYDIEDGLQNNEFNSHAYLKSRSGELFFGGINGFNIFHPDSIKDNTHIPPIAITEFQLNNVTVPVGFDSTTGRSILEKTIIETEEIELLHRDNVISFEFAALDYHIPEKNQYAYMMEGFDQKWNYRDADNRFVTYTNLDPGEYTFRVKGSNNDGYWNEDGASLRIIILPPWWATTWAYLIYALILLSIIYFTWRLQLKRIRIKHDYEMSKFEAEKMHEVDEMKSRFFANISHEFRTPLTLIFGPAKDIIEETAESKTKQNAGIIKRNQNKTLV